MSFDTDILIIGAGMSGIGLAVQLRKKYPQATYDIIEKSDNIGGTWWANTYPGCGCDVRYHLVLKTFPCADICFRCPPTSTLTPSP